MTGFSSLRTRTRRAHGPSALGPRLRVALFAVAAVVLVALVATTVVVLTNVVRDEGTSSTDSTGCSVMTVPVRYLVNPTKQTGLFTLNAADRDAAVDAGYTKDAGVLFRAAADPAAGLVEVHQLRRGTGDQLWTTNDDEVREAVQGWGYTDQGVVAYVSPVPAPCTVQVERFQSHGVHRYATTTPARDALREDGWTAEGSFYAARPASGASPAATPSRTARPTLAPDPSARPGSLTVIDADFDNVTTGPVTPDSFTGAVGSKNHEASSYDSMSYVTADDGTGAFVRTHLAAHKILGQNDKHGDGNVLAVPLEDQSEDSACISYDVRFSQDFEISAGGKLPGLLGVAPGVSPGTPTGGGSTDHGWSGRVMWVGGKLSRAVRESGQPDLAVTYFYHPGQNGTFGDDLSWGRGLVDGAWHNLRQCYTLNTVGEADGRLEAWLDGVPVLDRSDLVYRTDPKVHITHLDWSIFRGGDTDDWAADTGGDVDLDNLKVTVA